MNTLDRRGFVRWSLTGGLAAGLAPGALSSPAPVYPFPSENKISLAAWSLVRSFRAGVWKLTDVHRICREDFGIDGIEYVNTFFEVPLATYLDRLNQASREHGVRNVLIMVDSEGAMLSPDPSIRKQAAINHRKWVEVAAYLGCHAIRCNAHGGGKTLAEDPDSLERGAESFGALIEYAREFQINILIENHGGLSSDPEWLPALMKKVGSPHFGILPDFGNYTQGSDVAAALRKAMPFSKGVSVKAGWLPDGSHPQYDLAQLLQISKSSGYSGFWGIESGLRRGGGERSSTPESAKQDDWQAVLWTKAVIEKVVFS